MVRILRESLLEFLNQHLLEASLTSTLMVFVYYRVRRINECDADLLLEEGLLRPKRAEETIQLLPFIRSNFGDTSCGSKIEQQQKKTRKPSQFRKTANPSINKATMSVRLPMVRLGMVRIPSFRIPQMKKSSID